MIISMIVAMANNGVIGRDNKMPWHLPADLQYFKRVTMGKPIIMGRKTFDSIGKPLPGRTNIIVTRQTDIVIDGVEVVNSLDQALEFAANLALNDGLEEVMVIGGAQLYNEAIARTQRLYLTRINSDIDGDTYFPRLDNHEWYEVSRDNFTADSSNPFDYSFTLLERC